MISWSRTFFGRVKRPLLELPEQLFLHIARPEKHRVGFEEIEYVDRVQFGCAPLPLIDLPQWLWIDLCAGFTETGDCLLPSDGAGIALVLAIRHFPDGSEDFVPRRGYRPSTFSITEVPHS